MPTVNVVPRDSLSFERMAELAAGYGWQLDPDSVIAARKTDASPEWTWTADDGTVTLVLDSTLKRPFLTVDANDPQPLADRIESDVPCFTLAEIVEILTSAEAPEDRIPALRLLGAAAPAGVDETVLGAIRDNAARPEPRVRLAAITASSRPDPHSDTFGSGIAVRTTEARNLVRLAHWEDTGHRAAMWPSIMGSPHQAAVGSRYGWHVAAP